MPARKAPAKPKSAAAKPKASSAAKVTTRSKGSKPSVKISTTTPSEEAIRRRAYEIFLERGGAPGDPHQDWEAAAKELGAKRKKVAAK